MDAHIVDRDSEWNQEDKYLLISTSHPVQSPKDETYPVVHAYSNYAAAMLAMLSVPLLMLDKQQAESEGASLYISDLHIREVSTGNRTQVTLPERAQAESDHARQLMLSSNMAPALFEQLTGCVLPKHADGTTAPLVLARQQADGTLVPVGAMYDLMRELLRRANHPVKTVGPFDYVLRIAASDIDSRLKLTEMHVDTLAAALALLFSQQATTLLSNDEGRKLIDASIVRHGDGQKMIALHAATPAEASATLVSPGVFVELFTPEASECIADALRTATGNPWTVEQIPHVIFHYPAAHKFRLIAHTDAQPLLDWATQEYEQFSARLPYRLEITSRDYFDQTTTIQDNKSVLYKDIVFSDELSRAMSLYSEIVTAPLHHYKLGATEIWHGVDKAQFFGANNRLCTASHDRDLDDSPQRAAAKLEIFQQLTTTAKEGTMRAFYAALTTSQFLRGVTEHHQLPAFEPVVTRPAKQAAQDSGYELDLELITKDGTKHLLHTQTEKGFWETLESGVAFCNHFSSAGPRSSSPHRAISISIGIENTRSEQVQIEIRWDHNDGELKASFDPNLLPAARLGRVLGTLHVARHQRNFEVRPFDKSQPAFKGTLVAPLSVNLRRSM